MNFKNFVERKKIINKNIRIEKGIKKKNLGLKKISKKKKKKNRENNLQ